MKVIKYYLIIMYMLLKSNLIFLNLMSRMKKGNP